MSKHLDIVWTNQFKKDYKMAMKRHLDIDLLDDIIRKLASSEQLPEKNKDHALTGNWVGHRECHIQPDWLLVYRIENDLLILTLSRTGTYSVKSLYFVSAGFFPKICQGYGANFPSKMAFCKPIFPPIRLKNRP